MPPYAHRTDSNHRLVVSVFRTLGASVCDLSGVGRGCPDLLIGVAGIDALVEVKRPERGADGKKTGSALEATQVEFIANWKGRKVVVVRTQQDAVEVVSALRQEAARIRGINGGTTS